MAEFSVPLRARSEKLAWWRGLTTENNDWEAFHLWNSLPVL